MRATTRRESREFRKIRKIGNDDKRVGAPRPAGCPPPG